MALKCNHLSIYIYIIEKISLFYPVPPVFERIGRAFESAVGIRTGWKSNSHLSKIKSAVENPTAGPVKKTWLEEELVFQPSLKFLGVHVSKLGVV